MHGYLLMFENHKFDGFDRGYYAVILMLLSHSLPSKIGGFRKMVQTVENSYHSTSEDMGESHVKIHENQHTRLVKNEPLIETLTSNNSSDSSFDLMKEMAHKQGVMSEEEWQVHNQKIRPVRRKDSYDEYLASLCTKVVNGLKKRLEKKSTPRSKRSNYAQQLASINKNHGVPIDGSLFYLSNYHDYDVHAKLGDYKKYRAFERATYKKFFNSDEFKLLNSGCFRGEIHFDELGTMHLQTQSIWFKTDKRGRAQYSKRSVIKKALTEYYGSTTELNRRLDILCSIHADPKLNRSIGSERIDSRYNRMVKNGTQNDKFDKISSRERNGRIEELWRIEQLNVLSSIGAEMAKQYGVDWEPATTYQSDGQHRTRDAYIQHEEQTEQVRQTNKIVVASTKRNQQRAKRLKKNIDDSYKAVTGTERSDDVSDLDAVRTIRHYVKSDKSEHEKLEQENDSLRRENERLRQEQAQMRQVDQRQPWFILRQLIVDVIEALLPVLRELDHDGVTGQRWRDSVTEQVDRKMKQSPLLKPKQPQNGKSNQLER